MWLRHRMFTRERESPNPAICGYPQVPIVSSENLLQFQRLLEPFTSFPLWGPLCLFQKRTDCLILDASYGCCIWACRSGCGSACNTYYSLNMKEFLGQWRLKILIFAPPFLSVTREVPNVRGIFQKPPFSPTWLTRKEVPSHWERPIPRK